MNNLFRIFCYSQSESPFVLSYHAKEETSQKGRLSTPNTALCHLQKSYHLLKAVPEMCQHLNSGKRCDTHLLYLKKRKCVLMNVLTSISTPTSTQLVEFICLNSKLRNLNPADLEV